MPKKYSDKEPTKLSDILTGILKGKGWDTIVREHRVFDVWDEVVGTHIAKNTCPKRIDRGVLFVIVSNSAWIQELSLMKEQIIGRLNVKLNDRIVRDLRFAQGKISKEEKELIFRVKEPK